MSTTEVTIERMPLSAMVSLNREEIDIQVATAKKYPRDLALFEHEAIALTTAQPEFTARCTYAMPRGGKIISGPSIRFAECMQHAYGNTMAAGRVTEELEKTVVAQGVFIDLERNNRISREVKRKIVGRDGNRYNEDMITTTGNAAVSIAVRNAILAGIPRALWGPIYDKDLEIIGDPRDLPARIVKALELLAKKFQIRPEQVCRILRIDKTENIGPYEIVVLQGLVTALTDGEMTVDEAVRRSKPIPSMPRATHSKRPAAPPAHQQTRTVGATPEPPAESPEGEKQRSPKDAKAAPAKASVSGSARTAKAADIGKITENQFRDLSLWCNEAGLEMTDARRIAKAIGFEGASLKELPAALLKKLYEGLELAQKANRK